MGQIFQNFTVTLTIQEVLTHFLAALILGLAIYLSYRFSHSSAVYSARFNASLLMLTIITTMVMSVIGNSIALSLGMVGALSIVRFRTAIKDPRDTAYIFWCIAVGVCCGVSEYTIPAIGTGVVFLIMLILGMIRANNRYLLIIHADSTATEAIERIILATYTGKADLRVKNTTANTVEFIYEVSATTQNKLNKAGRNIIDLIYEAGNINQVDLVMQNEEVSQ